MPTATIMFGLPASGKSTWIEAHKSQFEKIISADTIKEHMLGFPEKYPRDEVHQLSVDTASGHVEKLSSRHLDYQFDLVVDAGGINNKYTFNMVNSLLDKGYDVTIVHLDTPLNICLARNAERNREIPVPVEAIHEKAVKLDRCLRRLLTLDVEYLKVPYFTRKHIFVDMDGTVAAWQKLPVDHEGNIDFVNGDVFLHARPMLPVISCLKELQESGSHIYILSASPNSVCNDQKTLWLAGYMPFVDVKDIYFVGNKDYKVVMLKALMRKLKIDPWDVSIVDDWNVPLRQATAAGIGAIHPSQIVAGEI